MRRESVREKNVGIHGSKNAIYKRNALVIEKSH